MNPFRSSLCFALRYCVLFTAAVSGLAVAHAEALKIAYSDWPGWVAWEIAIQKNWFKEAGVDVQFMWYDYAPSMDAYSTGKADAVCMTNGCTGHRLQRQTFSRHSRQRLLQRQ